MGVEEVAPLNFLTHVTSDSGKGKRSGDIRKDRGRLRANERRRLCVY